MLRQGVDLKAVMERDVSRGWNILYSLFVSNLDKKERKEFDSELFRRPKGDTRMVGDEVDIALMKGAQAYAKSLERADPALDLKGESAGQ